MDVTLPVFRLYGIWVVTVYYKVKPKKPNKGTPKLPDSRMPMVKGPKTFVVNKQSKQKKDLDCSEIFQMK